jgi:hypothetical protein
VERKFEFRGELYSVGDYIEIDDNNWFAFQSVRKCRIDFIGSDSTAVVVDKNGMKRTIVGHINN